MYFENTCALLEKLRVKMEMGQPENVCFSKNMSQQICAMATVLARLSATGDTPHPDKILQICLKNMKKVKKVKK